MRSHGDLRVVYWLIPSPFFFPRTDSQTDLALTWDRESLEERRIGMVASVPDVGAGLALV